MRFNGVNPNEIHPAIRVSRETPPGMAARKVRTLAAAGGEIVTGVDIEGARYIVRMNIAGRTRETGWAMREKIAAWAASSGAKTALLEPTHMLGRCYDAIVESVSDPEFVNGFAVVEVTFLLPRPLARSTIPSAAVGAGSVSMDVEGSGGARPVIAQTLEQSRTQVTWTMDGAALLRMSGSFAAGQVIKMDTARALVTIDGENAMAQVDPQATRFDAMTRGRHSILSADAGGMEARWHEEWL